MTNRTRRVIAVLGAAALTVPGAAVAAPGKGTAPAKSDGVSKTRTTGKAEGRAKAKGKAKAKKVKLATYVVKGVFDEAGQVDVTGGNSRTRRAGLVRDDVVFTFDGAKLVVADTNADGVVTEADIKPGDKLTIQLKLPRTLGAGPYAARKVVDRTHLPVDESDETKTGTEASSGGSSDDQPTATDAQ